MPDKDIGADIDGLMGQVDVELGWFGAEMHLLEDRLTLVDMRAGDHEVGVPFGIANAPQGAGEVIGADGVVDRSRRLAGSCNTECWIFPAGT